jgi:signal transduction histidine kinase
LRTPIAVLQAGCEAMLDQVRNPGPAEIGSLHEEVLRLARLVDDLQTLAAADAAALHLVMSRTDLAQVATEAADTLTPHIHEAGLTLNRDLEPAIVSADANRLRQVVLNLLTNAIKFTPTGGRITLTVRAHSATAELTVADTGIGIPSEELPRIFDRFWRSRHAGGTAGTGIGLAIVAGLVHAHNGTVDVDSTPGAGTAITVRLPLAAPVRAAVASI